MTDKTCKTDLRCPACGDREPIALPPERIGCHSWKSRWHCMSCGLDYDGETYMTPRKERP